MKRLLLIGGLLLATTVAFAAEPWKEPEDFRGLKWGASVSDMKTVFPKASATTHQTWGDRVNGFMVHDHYIGKIKTTLILGFLDDKFSHVHIMFESKDYSVLRDAFEERYGAPLSKEQRQLKTALGVEHTNEILTWKGSTLQVQIQRYAGSVRDARAHLTSHEYNEEMNKQLKQRGKTTAKDL